MSNISKHYQEGQAQFQVGSAFYRPASRRVRDLGVLAASVYRRQTGQLRVLDVMTGCGVRPLRYALESQADLVWANEGNPALRPMIASNLQHALPDHRFHLTTQPAQRLLANCLSQEECFDLVDIDSFGSPLKYLANGIAVTRLEGLLFLTATDGKSLAGHDSERALSQFNAYTRWHPAVHEQALRVLLGAVHQIAQIQGINIRPIFSFFCGQTFRVMVQVTRRAQTPVTHYGFLGYCHHCGEYQTVGWRSLNRATCPCATSSSTVENELNKAPHASPVLSGPLWLGPLHNSEYLQQMHQLALSWGWPTPAKTLSLMAQEVDFPAYYYPLAEIGRRGQMDIPNRDRLIRRLQGQGYKACQTSIFPQAIKTNAPLALVIQQARIINGDRRGPSPQSR